jgi:serine/threonine-protein kinase HipA
LLFNVLIGGHDNHLKNLSFLVGQEGIELAPAYDLLSTAAYRTLVYAKERANWPDVDLGIALPGAQTFAAVSRESVLAAGEVLGLPRQTGARELERMSRNLMTGMDRLETELRAENSSGRYPAAARIYFAGELRLVSVIRQIVAREMVARVAG